MLLRSRRKQYKRGPTGVYHRIGSRNLHSESYNSGALYTVGIPTKKDASLLLKVLNPISSLTLSLVHAVCFMFPDTQRLPGNAWARTNMRTFFYTQSHTRFKRNISGRHRNLAVVWMPPKLIIPPRVSIMSPRMQYIKWLEK